MFHGTREVWSVSDVVQYLYDLLDLDETLKRIWVEGEISNFSQHSKSRHMYFTLKDEKATIDAVMFAGNNRRLRFSPKNGDRVLVRGYVSLYIKDGNLQIYVQDMRLSGVGDLHVAFQRLKEQLLKEGLFDLPKKPLPAFPKKVGVITSAHGAAIRDIISTMGRRYPLARIYLMPVSVQGENASVEIANAIDEMNRLNEVDVIIVGRGGGSIEELWAFNEEIVARSISRSHIPIISAVGHETDTTISDFVADHRAATPTAAAEMVVPHVQDIEERLANLQQRLIRAQKTFLNQYQERLSNLTHRPVFRYPEARLLQYSQRLDDLEERLKRAVVVNQAGKEHQFRQLQLQLAAHHPVKQVKRLQERIDGLGREMIHFMRIRLNEEKQKQLHALIKLDALSPLKVMERGYSLVYRFPDQILVTSHQQIKPGDLLQIRLSDGQLKCQVWKSEERVDE